METPFEPFADWRNICDPEPTEDQLRIARERMLELGNRTEIDYRADEVPKAKRWEYRRLDQHNRDVFWQNRTDVNIQGSNDAEYKRYVLIAFGSQLELSDLQQQIAVERLFTLDLQRVGRQLEVIAFCVCAIISNKDATERYANGDLVYHPQRKDENNSEEFVALQNEIIENFGTVSKQAIQSIFQKLTQGNPPTRDTEDWQSFIESAPLVDRRPSYNPEYTVAPAEHPNQSR